MYLEDNKYLEKFAGTGQKNPAGYDLKTFLEMYNPNKHQNPSNTVDNLVFSYIEENGHKIVDRILLIKRANHPSIGWWALPGGFVKYDEDMDVAALRELEEETGINGIYAQQLKTYGKYDRDPRMRVITTAFLSLVPSGSVSDKAADDASDSAWFKVEDRMLDKFSDEKNIEHEVHELKLIQPERNIKTDSIIEITRRKDAVLEDSSYIVNKTNLLAADHGAIILEGYHYILSRIKECEKR